MAMVGLRALCNRRALNMCLVRLVFAPRLAYCNRQARRTHAQRTAGRRVVTEAAHANNPEIRTQTVTAAFHDDRRHIILAVDDTEDSQFACFWAIHNLFRHGDMFHVLHCIPTTKTHTVYTVGAGQLLFMDVMNEDEAQRVLHDAQHSMRHRFVKRLSTAGVPHQLDILLDDGSYGGLANENGIGAAVCRKANEIGAVAVVLASHNRSQLSEWFFGSVTNYCVHNCKQPVLVLHNPGLQHAEAAAQREQHGRHIIVAVDDSDAAFDACCWAADHLYRPGDTLHLMNVLTSARSYLPAIATGLHGGFYYQPMAAEDVRRLELSAVQQLSQRFSDLMELREVKHSVDVVRTPLEDPLASVGTAICQKANELNAAAVVMAAHHKGFLSQMFLGSVTDYCAHHCSSPVVVLH